MSEELKPCPFCGSTKASYDNDCGYDGGFWEWIACDECGAKVQGKNPEALWNRRTVVKEES